MGHLPKKAFFRQRGEAHEFAFVVVIVVGGGGVGGGVEAGHTSLPHGLRHPHLSGGEEEYLQWHRSGKKKRVYQSKIGQPHTYYNGRKGY